MSVPQRYVAYYRVSTKRQARSRLGLEDQRRKIHAFLKRGGSELLAEYTEHESAYRPARKTLATRPMLRDAIALCRETQATLLVATLHRLSRSFAFIASLMESDVRFLSVDMPRGGPLHAPHPRGPGGTGEPPNFGAQAVGRDSRQENAASSCPGT
jgi:DNA invertase Pin-like site-specific DNA recombinase